jgi:hypothetical protein
MFKYSTCRRFRRITSLFFAFSTVGATLLCASDAHATNCENYLAPFVAWASGYDHVEATITSNQSNGLASASVNYQERVRMKMSSPQGYLTNAISDWRVSRGKWTFSDRVSGSQPFSINSPDAIDVYIAWNGSVMYIYNAPWSAWITISPLTCEQGLIYGFGNPVGNHGALALYVFALTMEADIN